MISIFLIVRCLKVTQGLNTEITEVHSLAVHVHAAGHNTLQCRTDGRQVTISAKQSILDLGLVFLYLRVRHRIFLIICQGFIPFGRIRIVQFVHLIDDGIVLLQEVLHHIIDAIYIIFGSNSDILTVFRLTERSESQAVDFEDIAVAGEFRTI